jgi:hypothetical protein
MSRQARIDASGTLQRSLIRGIERRQLFGTLMGDPPFLRCQEKFLLSISSPDRISQLPSVVLPRDRSRNNLPRPIVVVPSGRLAATRAAHPAESGLTRAGAACLRVRT